MATQASNADFFPNLARILVVDDEVLIADTICLALTEEGYDVTTLQDGRSALSLLTSNSKNTNLSDSSTPQPFDLLILDLMLPSVNGLDICRLLRREGINILILILSARSSETDRVVGLEVGADDYLVKPFGMRELVARVRALLRRPPINLESAAELELPIEKPLIFEDLVLYPQQCRVTVRELEVMLSPKEFRLLEVFMRSPKRVWSREHLIEKVWGNDFIGESKTVDVHIRWLREKLELEPSEPQYLITIRGFGYRLGK
ncbi:MAG: response regulator transcription factor [Cyanobacteria bacterium]|nr:response regulator transcription factor [Cyanobacteriota bacterium]